MSGLLRRLLGGVEPVTDCQGDSCLSDGEYRYDEAMTEVRNGIMRSDAMTERAMELPSWEQLFKKERARDPSRD